MQNDVADAAQRAAQITWCQENLLGLEGRLALVTGAASGIGFETALGLAACGAQVLIADVSRDKGVAAAARIAGLKLKGQAEYRALDLSDLTSVRAFTEELMAHGQPLDVLVNNAGILPPTQRRTTSAGFELSFAISVVGHFALTARLLPLMLGAREPRVVWTSSLVQGHGRIVLDDLHAQRRYRPQAVYAQAKLASLMLALELQSRSTQAGAKLKSVAAHPGIARTPLGSERRFQKRNSRDRLEDFVQALVMRWLGQGAAQGARPLLHAAAAQGIRGGEFFGPDGFGQFSGEPCLVKPAPSARGTELRARLWQSCERMSGAPIIFDT